MLRRQFLRNSIALLGSTMTGISTVMAQKGAGFRLPEEAEPHERTFMQWPVSRRVHPDNVFLDMLQNSVAQVANTISEFEPVAMLMSAKFEESARRKLSQNVEIWDIPTDDLWCRDTGTLQEQMPDTARFQSWMGHSAMSTLGQRLFGESLHRACLLMQISGRHDPPTSISDAHK